MDEALRLADELQKFWGDYASLEKVNRAADLLRRQHAEIAALRTEVERLREAARAWEAEAFRRGKDRYEARAEIERLRKDAEWWKWLYRRAIYEANGLANYVEDRPELRSAERRLTTIEEDARAALKETNE